MPWGLSSRHNHNSICGGIVRSYLSVLVAAGAALAVSACTSPVKPPESVPEIAPGFLKGYLRVELLPDSRVLLPPPPAAGDAAFASDEEAYRSRRALRGSPRWGLAIQDADLKFPDVTGTFSCAVNGPLTPEATPRLYQLLRRSATDAGRAMNAAKDHYKRPRPFMQYDETSCTPQGEPALRRNGSYPSGHTAIGWAWALILAEVAPDRADTILGRGYAFGQSRVVCGVHWQSDVDAARVVSAGVVARLHADPLFAADLAAGKEEFAAARANGLQPTRDCAAESAALAAGR